MFSETELMALPSLCEDAELVRHPYGHVVPPLVGQLRRRIRTAFQVALAAVPIGVQPYTSEDCRMTISTPEYDAAAAASPDMARREIEQFGEAREIRIDVQELAEMHGFAGQDTAFDSMALFREQHQNHSEFAAWPYVNLAP